MVGPDGKQLAASVLLLAGHSFLLCGADGAKKEGERAVAARGERVDRSPMGWWHGRRCSYSRPV
jgi:hypothetical protein